MRSVDDIIEALDLDSCTDEELFRISALVVAEIRDRMGSYTAMLSCVDCYEEL